MKTSSLLSIFIKEISREKFFLFSLLIATVYFIFSIYLLNVRLVLQTIFGNFPLLYKLTLLATLLQGVQTAFSLLEIFLLAITALFVGINIMLLIATIKKLQQQGQVALSVGGGALIGLMATGCTSCGLSFLAILGLSASLSFLPFHGNELHILAIILLCISLVYMLQKLQEKVYCRVKKSK